jgi:hypothetical protein
VVASVNGEDISKEEFLREFEAAQRRLQQRLGERYSPELGVKLKPAVIQSMISTHMLAQLASELGYVTTQQELRAVIQSDDGFKEEGKLFFNTIGLNLYLLNIILCIKLNITKLSLLVIQRLHTIKH